MNPIIKKLTHFKRSLYVNTLIGSTFLSLTLLLSFFIVISVCEYLFWFSPTVRALFFYAYLIVFLFLFVVWVIVPAARVYVTSLQISDSKAARFIGSKISTIGDKLINTLQLIDNKSELAQASVEKNSSELLEITFEQAIERSKNYHYARLLLAPLLILLLVFSCDKTIIISSFNRIYNHNRVFTPPLPYSLTLLNQSLEIVENNDLEIKFLVSGKEVPVFFEFRTSEGRVSKLYPENDTLRYFLKSINRDLFFSLSTADYQSEDYKVKVIKTPKVLGLITQLTYPRHTNLKTDVFVNTYSYSLPYGTEVKLMINVEEVDSLAIQNIKDYKVIVGQGHYEVVFSATETSQILVSLINKKIQLPRYMALDLSIEPDQMPTITLSYFFDSLNSKLSFYGKISDDYGFNNLRFKYKTDDEDFLSKDLDFQKKLLQQSYYGYHDFSGLTKELNKGKTIQFYTEVTDNEVFKNKTAKSPTYKIVLLSDKELKKELAKQVESTKEAFEDIKDDSRKIQKEMGELQKKLMLNKKLDWNDIKRLEELKKENMKIQEKLKEIDRNVEKLNLTREKNKEIQDEKLQEKMQQLKKLMDELLDEKTKQLYEQLSQLYEQKLDPEELEKLMEKIKNQTEDLEKEVDKALEYFKKLDIEIKMKELSNEFDKLAELQDSLSKEQFEDKKLSANENLQQQKQVNEQLQNALEKLDSLQNESKDLDQPLNLDQEEQLSEELKNDSQDLEKQMSQQESKPSNKEKQSNKTKQQNLSKKMKQMAKNLKMKMEDTEKEKLEEDMNSLTRTLENLIKISYEQEDVMVGLRKIRSIDPLFLKLSQQQLKIKGDFELIKDSLEALSARVVQVKPFVSEEVRLVNEKIKASLDHLKNKRISMATNEQQFAMTSMNNLAVMLSEILDQMQNDSDSQSSSSSKSKKNKSNKNKKPSMSELQQSLNQQLENLKKSGKNGRELSEELRKLAVQQEMIRQMMKQHGQKPGNNKETGKDGKGGDKMDKMMQDSKNDMINKRVSDQLINRQKEILTRLLESEKAEKERGMKEEREAEKPKTEYDERKDLLLEKYLNDKKQQIEEIQRSSPLFLPFYKKNIENYNRKIAR